MQKLKETVKLPLQAFHRGEQMNPIIDAFQTLTHLIFGHVLVTVLTVGLVFAIGLMQIMLAELSHDNDK